MTSAQAPAPDLSFLQGLDPGVAYAALVVIALGMLLFYLGPGLRDRFSKKPPAEKPSVSDTGSALPVVPPPSVTPTAAVDKADRLTDQLIGVLKDQLVSTERERDDARREVMEMQRRLDRSEHENDRLRWQRGSP